MAVRYMSALANSGSSGVVLIIEAEMAIHKNAPIARPEIEVYRLVTALWLRHSDDVNKNVQSLPVNFIERIVQYSADPDVCNAVCSPANRLFVLQKAV